MGRKKSKIKFKNKVFAKYYEVNLGSLVKAAKFFKYSKSSVSYWLRGQVVPSPMAIQVIAKKTRNAVPANTWFPETGSMRNMGSTGK